MSLHQYLADAYSANAELQKERDQLRAELEESRKSGKWAAKEIAGLRERNDELFKLAQERRAELEEAKRDRDEYQARSIYFQKQEETLEADNEALRGRLGCAMDFLCQLAGERVDADGSTENGCSWCGATVGHCDVCELRDLLEPTCATCFGVHDDPPCPGTERAPIAAAPATEPGATAVSWQVPMDEPATETRREDFHCSTCGGKCDGPCEEGDAEYEAPAPASAQGTTGPKRPTIAELEAILDDRTPHKIEINPDGSVHGVPDVRAIWERLEMLERRVSHDRADTQRVLSWKGDVQGRLKELEVWVSLDDGGGPLGQSVRHIAADVAELMAYHQERQSSPTESPQPAPVGTHAFEGHDMSEYCARFENGKVCGQPRSAAIHGGDGNG